MKQIIGAACLAAVAVLATPHANAQSWAVQTVAITHSVPAPMGAVPR
jgi:hypothetical protein